MRGYNLIIKAQVIVNVICAFVYIVLKETRIHHIICDGWGTSVIQKGILEIYCRLIKNEVVNATPAPSFIDFIEKEDKYINSFRFLKDKEYWNEKYSNISDISEEFLYNNTHEVKGRRSIFNLDDKISMKIKEFLEEKRISGFINEVALDIKRDLYHQRYPYDELVKDLEISKVFITSYYKRSKT